MEHSEEQKTQNKKTERFEIRISESDRKRILKNAISKDMKMTEYIREQALSPIPSAPAVSPEKKADALERAFEVTTYMIQLALASSEWNTNNAKAQQKLEEQGFNISRMLRACGAKRQEIDAFQERIDQWIKDNIRR